MARTNLIVVSLAAALVAAVVGSWIDFGYRGPPPEAADANLTAPPDADSSGCTEGAVPPPDTGPQIGFATLAVDQPVLAITAGAVVTWTNNDTMVHTVTAGAPGAPLPLDRGGFDSGDLPPAGKWAYRFCSARTVIYYCKTHAGQMNNYRVVVGP